MLSSLYPNRSLRIPPWAMLLLLLCRFAPAQTASVSALSVPLDLPSAVAYDAAGNLYIAEVRGHAVRRVDASGLSTRFAGDGSQGFGGDGGPASAAQLDSPQGLAVDAAGNVYVSDSGNNRIRRIDAATGTILTVAGSGARGFSGDGGAASRASLNLPRGICLDATGTQLYVADSRNHRVRHVDLTAQTIGTYAGSGIEGFSGDGGPAIAAALDTPESLALDPSGNLLVADTQNGRIRRVAAGTGVITTLPGAGGLGGPASIALDLPRGVTLDAQGNIYIADARRHRVVRLDHVTGAVSVVAGAGTQGYAGDGSAAMAAALDSPRAIVLSPGGLLTVADTANLRVRQLLAAPAAATPIQTIAGLGVTVPGIFTLSAPSVQAYGSGTIAASLRAGEPASGQVTFFDVGANANSAIGTAPMVGNAATLNVSTLPAGEYRIMATYAGDATHGAAQTPVLNVTIATLSLRVAASTATMTYGTAPPALGGTVDGLLPQDAAKVSASFAAAATATSPAGSYPIAASLAGPAAANYTVEFSPANLVVTQASSSVLVRNISADGSFNGVLQVQASSSTSGTPTGAVMLLDGGTLLQRGALTGGVATFSATGLAAGTHLLSASYGGDGNFLPSTSAALTATIAPPVSADFALVAAAPVSQTLSSGGAVTFTISVQMTGGSLNSPIQLAVTGLPAFTTASFSPSYIPPGGTGSTTAVLTVTSTASAAMMRTGGKWSWPTSLAFAVPLPLLGCLVRRRHLAGARVPIRLAVVLLGSIVAPLLSGCGDRVFPHTQSGSSTQSYTLTVNGTATGNTGATLQHSASLTLQMLSAQ